MELTFMVIILSSSYIYEINQPTQLVYDPIMQEVDF